MTPVPPGKRAQQACQHSWSPEAASHTLEGSLCQGTCLPKQKLMQDISSEDVQANRG